MTNNNLESFVRRINTTRQSRFEASRRLIIHNRVSQWMIAILSAALIAIPLIDFTPQNFQKQNNFFQVLIATFVLIYSIIISSENFFHRSKKMEDCAKELSTLLSKLYESNPDFQIIQNSYDDIIIRYENHEYLDYRLAKHNETSYSDPTSKSLVSIWLRILFLFTFFYYTPLIVLMYFFVIKFAIPFINN